MLDPPVDREQKRNDNRQLFVVGVSAWMRETSVLQQDMTLIAKMMHEQGTDFVCAFYAAKDCHLAAFDAGRHKSPNRRTPAVWHSSQMQQEALVDVAT